MIRIVALAILLLGSSSANAHPGHGPVDSGSPLHYVLSFEHALPLIVIGMVAIATIGWAWRHFATRGVRAHVDTKKGV